MKTDLDIIAEQCAEIDRRNGDAPLPPVLSEPLLADDLRLILSVIACACPSSRHKCDCQDRRKAVAVIEAAIAQANDKLSGGEAVRPDAWLAAAFELVRAARRVRAKFGTDDNGTPLDWSEWRDVDDACNAVDRVAANVSLHGRTPAQGGQNG